MIPFLLVLRIRTDRGRTIRLWVPLILVWVLLLPIAIPAVIVMCLLVVARGTRPLRILATGWRLLRGLRGLVIDVDAPDSTVYLKII